MTNYLDSANYGGTDYELHDTTLRTGLQSGSETDALFHLGLYIDNDGDICQKED